MQKILLLSGTMATGKTSIVKRLANKYDKSAYIDTDIIKWFIQNGFISEVDVENGKGTMETCIKQHSLAIDCATDIIFRFYKEGYNIFIADLVYTEEFEAQYDKVFQKMQNIQLNKIHLTASNELVYKRGFGNKIGVTMQLIQKYNKWFSIKNKKGWYEICTNEITIDQVYDRVVKTIEDTQLVR